MPAPKKSPVPTRRPMVPRPRPFRDISPEAERGDQDLMRILEADEAAGAIERGNRNAEREARDRDSLMNFKDGGMVRGCKSGQTSGKGFRGTY